MAVLLFLVVLSSLVLVHEFGHFWVAKKSGCAIEEFGIGFPPRLFGIKRGETIYSINWLPFGGFVKIKGENGDEHPDARSFATKSFAWKTFIISAGVLMNIAFGYVLLTATLMIGLPTVIDQDASLGRFAQVSNHQVAIVEVLPDSPADKAGIQAGDVIDQIDGQPVQSVTPVLQRLAQTTPTPATMNVTRGDQHLTFTVTPAELPDLHKEGIGIGLEESALVRYPWYAAPFYGIQETGQALWMIIAAFGDLVRQLVVTRQVSGDVAGPIGIAVITGQVARLGLVHVLQFAALLSLNLAVINILPIPALDGGRLAFIIAERVRGKQMRASVEQWIQLIGFGALIVLMIAVTAHDLGHYGPAIWAHVRSFFG